MDEMTRRLQRAIDKLSDKKREVFVLITVEGLSGQDAAEVLNIPVNTVWTRLHHARLELRAAVEEDER
jgi:RNA polymerase sigma-70 factor (ECF subfamily)